MRILFDECVPWPASRLLVDHDCSAVQRRGWSGVKNGELLRLAEGQFDLFLTADQNLQYQQNLRDCRMAILVLSTNDLRRIRAAASALASAISAVRPGELRRLDIR